MSFGFVAVGDQTEIGAQLETYQQGQYVSADGAKVAAFVGDLIAGADAAATDGYEFRYVVEASGHFAAGSSASLNVAVKSYMVPVTAPSGDSDTPAVNEGSESAPSPSPSPSPAPAAGTGDQG